MRPTLLRGRGTQNLNSSPLRLAKSVEGAMAWSCIIATCLDIIFVVAPFFVEEITDDFLIKSIFGKVIVLPLCIG